MHNEEQSTEKDDSSKLKRKTEEIPHISRRKLLRRKIHRTIPESEKYNQDVISETGNVVLLVNPQSKIPSSHNALEQANQSEVPEAAYYPSQQGHNFMMGMQLGDGLAGAPEFIPLGSPQLPPMDCPEEDLESHQYQEIMQMLLQAIHNQNRIMEECKNILTSIHNAITPVHQPAPPAPPPPAPPPPVQQQQQQPQQQSAPPPTAAFNTVPIIIPPNSQPAQLMPLWNPKNDSQMQEETPQQVSILQQIQQHQHHQQKVAENAHHKSMSTAPVVQKAPSSSSSARRHSIKAEPKEAPPHTTLIPTIPQPQPPPINLQTVSSSKEPDKPTVYGPDGEFSSAYLRYVYSKSSTATSFANVLMKEVFNLEERISSNCNGVMGKKALEPERLDKIKRAVKRFYTDTDEEFQDLWKKCRKSIDSTNRNLKFVIMKKPTL